LHLQRGGVAIEYIIDPIHGEPLSGFVFVAYL
jgi:hypothetical protein